MAEVYVGLGSNIDKEKNIFAGLAHLGQQFGDLQQSAIYESPAVGFEGASFYNLVVTFQTKLAPLDLISQLKLIEQANGRPANARSFSARTLDIDLLLYDDLTFFNHQYAISFPFAIIMNLPNRLSNAFFKIY